MNQPQEKMRVYRYRLRFAKSPAGSPSESGFLTGQAALKKAFLEFLPLARTGKRHKFSFGPALPHDYYSECEYADVWLSERIEVKSLAEVFSRLSGGFKFIKAESLPLFFPSVEAVDTTEEYEIFTAALSEGQKQAFAVNVKVSPLLICWKGPSGEKKEADISQWIEKAYLKDDGAIIFLKRIKGKSVRPELVIKGLAGLEVEIKKIVKKNIFWTDSTGRLNEI
ncbi:MAG: hypothetical protein Fur0012_07290 [Elusimicrobiota bacterium]